MHRSDNFQPHDAVHERNPRTPTSDSQLVASEAETADIKHGGSTYDREIVAWRRTSATTRVISEGEAYNRLVLPHLLHINGQRRQSCASGIDGDFRQEVPSRASSNCEKR